jgi:hypothetical protein
MQKRWLAVLVLALSAVPTFVACARTLTPEQVSELGKKSYPTHAPEAVMKASVTALRTLGFEIVVAEGGQVKTAPKPVMVTASGGGGVAYAASNDIAWTLTIEPAGDGSSVHAVPRMITGGTSYDGPVDAAYMEKAVADLFKEIESNLH